MSYITTMNEEFRTAVAVAAKFESRGLLNSAAKAWRDAADMAAIEGSPEHCRHYNRCADYCDAKAWDANAKF